MRFTRTVTRLVAASIIGIAMAASPQAAGGDSPPGLDKPTISGAPVVGATLTASASATGDPMPTLAYEWFHCHPKRPTCDAIPEATGSSYVVSADYVGRRLAVRVTATNPDGIADERTFTEVVTAPPPPEPTPEPTPVPTPEPTPAPTPDPNPTAGDEDVPLRFDQSSPSPVVPAVEAPAERIVSVERNEDRAPYLRPFPVVRITGTVVAGGARVSRLQIRAPTTARVAVRCRRSGCRFFSRSTGGGRVRALERFLPAGTRITIRVTRPGMIGKHVVIVIRDGARPRRRDACLMPGSTRPVPCPAR
jgi:hypothetical protein